MGDVCAVESWSGREVSLPFGTLNGVIVRPKRDGSNSGVGRTVAYHCSTGLGMNHENYNEARSGKHHQKPKNSSPAKEMIQKPADDGAKSRT